MGEVSGGLVVAGMVLGGISTALLIGSLVVYIFVFLEEQKYIMEIKEILSLNEQAGLTLSRRKFCTRLNSKMLEKWESNRSTGSNLKNPIQVRGDDEDDARLPPSTPPVQQDPFDPIHIQPDPFDPIHIQPDPFDPIHIQPDPFAPPVQQDHGRPQSNNSQPHPGMEAPMEPSIKPAEGPNGPIYEELSLGARIEGDVLDRALVAKQQSKETPKTPKKVEESDEDAYLNMSLAQRMAGTVPQP